MSFLNTLRHSITDILPETLTNRKKKQKQQIINDFINPFYADYKENQALSLTQKELQDIFEKRYEMQQILQGTPKHQLKQLFQTKRQEEKIQDVLNKASLSTLKYLKQGVERFDQIFFYTFVAIFTRYLDEKDSNYSNSNIYLTPSLHFRSIIRNPTEDNFNENIDFSENMFFTDVLHKLFKRENANPSYQEPPYPNEFIEMEHYKSFMILFYKLQLYIKKRFRPRFLNEWLNTGVYTDTSFLFAMYDILKCPEFKSYIEKMLVKDFSRLNYNKLFDDIVKYIMNQEKHRTREKGGAVQLYHETYVANQYETTMDEYDRRNQAATNVYQEDLQESEDDDDDISID